MKLIHGLGLHNFFTKNNLPRIIKGKIVLIVVLLGWAGIMSGGSRPGRVSDGKTMTLAEQGKAKCVIVIADQATPDEKTAAQILQTYLREITGGVFTISPESAIEDNIPQILVGHTKRLAKLYPDVNWRSMNEDGIFIKTAEHRLILSGGRPRGTIYAVYDFLENVIGCRWWTATEKSIPFQPTCRIPQLNISYVPPLSYRETDYDDVKNYPEFAVILKTNGHFSKIPSQYGGHYSILGWCHTFFKLLPPGKYFKSHPEWYSKIKGERQFKNGQLCLTNEAMRKEMTQSALEWLSRKPNTKIISISQMDNGVRCECKKCQALEAAEGAPSGSLIHFINAVASDLAKQYPDLQIETLAYQYTQKPPRHIKPASNVLIRLCTERCSSIRPLTDSNNQGCQDNQIFCQDMESWSKLTPNLYVWDYLTNFSNPLVPHPNLHVLAPNIRFFVQHNARGVFAQGGRPSIDTLNNFSRLKTWLVAHLMWNPELDETTLINTFVNGYYGKAGTYILAYMDLIRRAFESSGRQLYMWNGRNPFAGASVNQYMNLEQMNRATHLFQMAEKSVDGDAVLSLRVRRERLQLDLLWLIHYRSLTQEAKLKKLPFAGPTDLSVAARNYLENVYAIIPDGDKNVSFKKYEPFLLSLCSENLDNK